MPEALRAPGAGQRRCATTLRSQIIAQTGGLRPATQQRVFRVYLGDAPAAVAKLRGSLQNNDASAVTAQAHRLKSSSAALGAVSAAALCHELEKAARSGSVADAGSLLSLIADEVDWIVVELSSMIESAPEVP
jgi:HPt (histidine-containing phosphotransfer) domain-containing protein